MIDDGDDEEEAKLIWYAHGIHNSSRSITRLLCLSFVFRYERKRVKIALPICRRPETVPETTFDSFEQCAIVEK